MRFYPKMKKITLTSVGLALIGASCAANLSFDEAVNQYSAKLVENANYSISSPSNPEKTSDIPTYVITYQIENDKMKTRKDADTNQTSYLVNTGITQMWTNMFCTQELKEIMRKYEIFMITGQLTDKNGEKHSMSVCMK